MACVLLPCVDHCTTGLLPKLTASDHGQPPLTAACMQGRVQEILLTTDLDTKALKQLVQNVLKRLI